MIEIGGTAATKDVEATTAVDHHHHKIVTRTMILVAVAAPTTAVTERIATVTMTGGGAIMVMDAVTGVVAPLLLVGKHSGMKMLVKLCPHENRRW